MTKFALLCYSTGNIGDEIQSVAAERFLPQVDYYLNRDYLHDFIADSTDEEIKLIMNGWYSHHPQNFPLKHPQIHPLLISMYIDGPVQPIFSSKENVEFFRKFGPVGARSYGTKEFFEKIGVETYWSGCLTLTLQREKDVPKQDFILAVDVSNEVYEKMKSESKLPVVRLMVDVAHIYMSTERRMKLAKYYLYLYQSARLVVTTRLHGMLPSLALGTPVLNISLPSYEEGRFSGLRELVHSMTEEEFLAGAYDVNRPKENPDTFLPIRESLIRICREYTGFCSGQGYLNGQPVVDFLSDPDLIQSFATGLWSAHLEHGIYR
ncbi:TPA: polysaccharide pyruvyl transferase family protein [Streptococcus suis]|nr:polysaccharide pyruvyl transferase family protein [Streptococcus suis]